MPTTPNKPAPLRKPVNLTLNAELLKACKHLGINLSHVAEEALSREVRRRLGDLWLEENAASIRAYNTRVETKGVAGDEHRRF